MSDLHPRSLLKSTLMCNLSRELGTSTINSELLFIISWRRVSSELSELTVRSNFCRQTRHLISCFEMAQNLTAAVEVALPASRLWAAMKSFHLIFPHLAPGAGDTMEVIEGKSGEAGSVSKMTIGATKGGPVGAFSKEKLTSIDDEKLTLSIEEIEGGHLTLGFTKWVTTTKLIPTGDKTVKMEISIEYVCDPTCPVCDMVLEQTHEGIPLTFKAVEVYILSTDLFL